MEYAESKQAQQRGLLLNVLNTEKFADTTFIIGADRKEYNINRTFLATISPVFEAMLFGQMKESKINSQVIISDIEANIFECVINFAYCNDPKISQNNVVSLHQIADKYQIETLLNWCDEYFVSCLNETNVCTFLNECVRLNQAKVRQKCYEFIENDSVDMVKVLQSSGFKELQPTEIRQILKSDHLHIKEEILWKHVLKWAEYQSKIDKIDAMSDADEKDEERDKISMMKTVYDLIRFGLMDGRFFCTKVLSENVLSKDEIITVLMYSQAPESGCGIFNIQERAKGIILLPYQIAMSSQCEKGGNTYHALINKNLNEKCSTKKDDECFIECKFDAIVRIQRIEIGPPSTGAKYLNGATLWYTDDNGEWELLQDLPKFEENKIRTIHLDLKTNAISIDGENDNRHLSIGCLRVFGCKT